MEPVGSCGRSAKERKESSFVTVEHPTASSTPEAPDHTFEVELQAEHGLGRAIIIGVLIAVPINVGVWVGLIAFAVSRAGAAMGGPIGMAVGVGVLSGLFFGSWAAFVAKTHQFEELDRKTDSTAGNSGADAPDSPLPSPSRQPSYPTTRDSRAIAPIRDPPP
jgi:hypothetical protein